MRLAVNFMKNDCGLPCSANLSNAGTDKKARTIASAPTVKPSRFGNTPTAVSDAVILGGKNAQQINVSKSGR